MPLEFSSWGAAVYDRNVGYVMGAQNFLLIKKSKYYDSASLDGKGNSFILKALIRAVHIETA